MSTTEPPAVTAARTVLAEFKAADRVRWAVRDWAEMAHRLAAGLADILAAYDDATGGVA